MFRIQYNYFDSKGNQKTKDIERTTISALVKVMKKHLENNELYHINGVSPNMTLLNMVKSLEVGSINKIRRKE